MPEDEKKQNGLNEQPPVAYDVPKAEDQTEPKPENPSVDFSSKEPETPPASDKFPELAITKPPTPTKSHKKLILIIIVVLLLLVGGAAAAYFLYFKKEASPTPSASTSQQQPAEPQDKEDEVAVDEALQKFIKPTTGETWLAAPKQVADLGYLKTIEGNGEREVTYYEVGKRGENIIYMSVEAMLGDSIYLYEKQPDGTVSVIVRPDGEGVYNEESEAYYPENFATAIKIDKNRYYDSLTMPQSLDLGNGYSVTRPQWQSLGDLIRPSDTEGGGAFTKIKDYGSSRLEKYEFKYPDTSLTSTGYILALPIGTRVALEYIPLETEAERFQWSVGAPYVNDEFSAISRGCGNRFAAITRADSVVDADVVEVGKSPSGKKVYHLTRTDHPIIKKAYEEFKTYTENYKEDPNANISLEDFVKQHAVILHKDNNGQWLVYARGQLRPAYGCAKPVVYLYPEKAQNVMVRVGADVKVSEPFYNPIFGWNTYALPNGVLNVGGQTYDSLFWEGPGWGEYPIINEGVIVKTDDALSIIRQQLLRQGLNEKEIADFIEYWKPNLPEKPYIRLTWLNTAQLDKLAPLDIKPKPDTVIRVFLDYAGLDEPYAIKPQNLSAVPRSGFTVVEWGGLATKKIY